MWVTGIFLKIVSCEKNVSDISISKRTSFPGNLERETVSYLRYLTGKQGSPDLPATQSLIKFLKLEATFHVISSVNCILELTKAGHTRGQVVQSPIKLTQDKREFLFQPVL